MYTGYYAKIKEYKKEGLIPISIAGKAPDWYDGIEYKRLAPKWEFFNEWKNGSHKGDNDYYIQQFQIHVLDKLNVEIVKSELMGLANGVLNKIILLCYEKPTDFCHRHLVADWINKHEGYNFINEYCPKIDLSKYHYIDKLEYLVGVVKSGKHYKLIFDVGGAAYTLQAETVEESKNGWTVKAEVQYDYLSWINYFEASKGRNWVKGNFEDIVECSSLKALNDFLSNYEVESWCYADI